MQNILRGVLRNPFSGRKAGTTRPVFSLRCDRIASQQLKNLAKELDSPTGYVGEHAIGVGIAFIRWQLGTGEETRARTIPALRKHLMNEHLLVDRLAHVEDLKSLPAYAMPPKKDRLMVLACTLLAGMEERGLSPEHLLEALGDLIAAQVREKERVQAQEALKREVDLHLLRQVNETAPHLLRDVFRVVAFYRPEEIIRTLGLERDQRGAGYPGADNDYVVDDDYPEEDEISGETDEDGEMV